MSAVGTDPTGGTRGETSGLDVTFHNVTHARRQFYRPELDVVRFFAFLAVFVHHGVYELSPVLSRCGAFGLSLFFLLSAFLITELLQREKAITGSIAIGEFYVRRSLRIWPLYYGFVVFAFGLGVLYPSHCAPHGFVLSFAFMMGNVYIGRHGFPNSPAGFLWSISVEEQFYLLWPLLNRYCGRRSLRNIALLSLPLGSIAVVVLTAQHATAMGIWTNSIVQFQTFACGVLLSLTLNGLVPRLSAGSRVALLAIGCAFWFTAARWSGINDFGVRGALGPLIGYYLVGAGCVALFFSAYGLGSRHIPTPLVYCGKISYGLYVFHQLCLEVSSWVLNRIPSTASRNHHVIYGVGHLSSGLLLTIGVAMLSYRYFETPFLKLKEKFTVIHSRSV